MPTTTANLPVYIKRKATLNPHRFFKEMCLVALLSKHLLFIWLYLLL